MSAPSRQFLVTQSVLNAAKRTMPVTLRKQGVVCVLKLMAGTPLLLKDSVAIEYRKLIVKYGLPAANDDSAEELLREASAGALK